MANLLLLKDNKIDDGIEFLCGSAFNHELAFCNKAATQQTFIVIPTCANMMEFALIVIQRGGDECYNYIFFYFDLVFCFATTISFGEIFKRRSCFFAPTSYAFNNIGELHLGIYTTNTDEIMRFFELYRAGIMINNNGQILWTRANGRVIMYVGKLLTYYEKIIFNDLNMSDISFRIISNRSCSTIQPFHLSWNSN
jgi:hypothetical protein